MSEIFDMLLNLICPREPFPPSTRARVFAAVYGAVVKLCGVLSIAMFALYMPIKILPLSEAFRATQCRAFVRFIVRVSMLAILVLTGGYPRGGVIRTNLSLERFGKLVALQEGQDSR